MMLIKLEIFCARCDWRLNLLFFLTLLIRKTSIRKSQSLLPNTSWKNLYNIVGYYQWRTEPSKGSLKKPRNLLI